MFRSSSILCAFLLTAIATLWRILLSELGLGLGYEL